MKGTQTVFDGQPLAGRLRGTIQGYAKPDFDLPSLDTDFVDDEAKKFLALVKIQLVDSNLDLVGETFDTLTQSVVLSQFLALGDQRFPLRFESASPDFQLLAAAQKLLPLDEIRLVEISQSPALGSSAFNLTI